MDDILQNDDWVISDYPGCSLGYRAVNATQIVEYVSPESSLYGSLQKGDQVLHYRLSGEQDWRPIAQGTDTHGPVYSKIDLMIKRLGVDEPMIVTGWRRPFIGIKNVVTHEERPVLTDAADAPNCGMMLSGDVPLTPFAALKGNRGRG